MEAERDGTIKVRDTQRWKRINIIKPRSYAQAVTQPNRSTHQEDPDVGAGANTTTEADGAPQGEAAQDGDEGPQVQANNRGQTRVMNRQEQRHTKTGHK